MKREDIDAILKNTELDDSGKISAILNLRGGEENAWKTKYGDLETRHNDLSTKLESYKDYDAIKTEVETLRAEKADRESADRFKNAVGGKTFVNAYTAEGVRKEFDAARALAENEGKTDAEVFAKIAEGKEREWFGSSVRISMTPAAGTIDTPTNFESFIEEKYKNNPFAKIL